MTFNEMISTYCLTDRIFYYSSDVDAIANTINKIRLDLDLNSPVEKELETDLRVVYLALRSLSNSLDRECDNLVKEEVKK